MEAAQHPVRKPHGDKGTPIYFHSCLGSVRQNYGLPFHVVLLQRLSSSILPPRLLHRTAGSGWCTPVYAYFGSDIGKESNRAGACVWYGGIDYLPTRSGGRDNLRTSQDIPRTSYNDRVSEMLRVSQRVKIPLKPYIITQVQLLRKITLKGVDAAFLNIVSNPWVQTHLTRGARQSREPLAPRSISQWKEGDAINLPNLRGWVEASGQPLGRSELESALRYLQQPMGSFQTHPRRGPNE